MAEIMPLLQLQNSAENECVHGHLSITVMITGFRWASAAQPTFFEAKADAEVVQLIKAWTHMCIVGSIIVLFFGVTTAGELGQELMKLFTEGNTTMNTTTVS